MNALNSSFSQIGGRDFLTFESELDKVESILRKLSNPYVFLCEAFNLKADMQCNRDVIDM